MERLTQENFRALLQVVREINTHLDLKTFKVQVLSALSQVIPAELSVYSEIDLPGQRVSVAAKPPEALPPDTERILARHLHDHPLIEHYQRTGDSRAVKLSDLLTRR